MSAVVATTASPLDLYEPLEIIGNGSFGIIRKVRRKADGEILARKELNFERMSERDRKQIVAEVNILKDLHHDNIVKYIDRFVDRDAGILYILMEYCDGGDLSSVIKQSARSGRPLPEDTVWSYFLQLLLALQHCHCPSAKSGENGAPETKRQQILHRDLKPENVFISKGSMVKLGDFGLSKALSQTSFANTYVGTPYYMSPELIQEKSYDTKSDIWSLGCLIYELCATKPPFHEAQTHSELSMLIRNGRIPPLPKGYSSALNHVVKAMLNLNPAMRPSAQQLLQHERIDFARKVADTEKMLTTVKMHKVNVLAKERDLQTLSAALAQREAELTTIISKKDAEITRMASLVSQADERTKRAVAAREADLRAAVMRREEEVRTAMTRREEEILEAVRAREDEINGAWEKREKALRDELEAAVKWVEMRHKELADEAEAIEAARIKLAEETEEREKSSKVGRKEKTPLEEVKNLLTPYRRIAHEEVDEYENTPRKSVLSTTDSSSTTTLLRSHTLEVPLPANETIANITQPFLRIPGSAMRGVVLTSTGETLQTPAPFGPRSKTDANAALTKIIKDSPRVGLNFRKIFDFADSETSEDDNTEADPEDESATATLTTTSRSGSSCDQGPATLNTPTRIKARSRTVEKEVVASSSSTGSISTRPRGIVRSQSSSKIKSMPGIPKLSPQKPGAKKTGHSAQVKPRRLSGRLSSGRPGLPVSASSPALTTVSTDSASTVAAKSAPPPTPHYDPSDEENLPSPFLRRIERAKLTRVSGAGSALGSRRKSNQNSLRVKAATNSANHLQALNGVKAS